MTDEEFGDPGIAWGEANAANDDGQAVTDAERAAEEARAAEIDAEVTALVKRWPQAIKAASDTTLKAFEIWERLGSERDGIDPELFETEAGATAGQALMTARQQLHRAAEIAASRLKLVEDAERDAELIRLRAENAELRARLEGTCPGGC